MDTRKVTTEYRMDQWSKVIQRRMESGQTITDFCEAEGIKKHQYFYWQRKLREAACTDLSVADNSTSISPSRWLRLNPSDTQGSNKSLSIEINGCCLEVNSSTDTELLKKICRTLRSL